MTPHNEANLGDFAKTVIMPGDPLRAKYIAENFLTDYKLVNQVRGMLSYTGKYKGKEISVMAHGMGIPSAGIYTYELCKFYGVENIIRIGSCGAHSNDLNLFDVILSQKVYSESTYAHSLNDDNCNLVESSSDLNSIIQDTAKDLDFNLIVGNTMTTDVFDAYVNNYPKFLSKVPQDLNILAFEMEAFAIFYNARLLGKKAACLMSVVDITSKKQATTPEERQLKLNEMITLALESAIKI